MYPKLFSTSLLLQLTFACGDSPPSESTTSVDATESKTLRLPEQKSMITLQRLMTILPLPQCQSNIFHLDWYNENFFDPNQEFSGK